MSSSLQDDLLQEFKAERKMIYNQLEVLDPLATSLRKPAAQRLISNGALIICEILCYLSCLTAIAFMIFMTKIYPFHILSDLFYDSQVRATIGMQNLTFLNIGVYVIVGMVALLLFIVARMVRRIRLKNNILQLAGRDMKLIVAQYLQRKAAIDAIDQRHFLELPQSADHDSVTVNDAPNHGFGA